MKNRSLLSIQFLFHVLIYQFSKKNQQYFCSLYQLATLGSEIDRQDKFENACPISVLPLPSTQHQTIVTQLRFSFYSVIPLLEGQRYTENMLTCKEGTLDPEVICLPGTHSAQVGDDVKEAICLAVSVRCRTLQNIVPSEGYSLEGLVVCHSDWMQWQQLFLAPLKIRLGIRRFAAVGTVSKVCFILCISHAGMTIIWINFPLLTGDIICKQP